MSDVGFGYAVGGKYGRYFCEKVFSRSGSCNYHYISWPASGYFPSSMFQNHEAWSVTVSPNEYSRSFGNVEVQLTRKSDGKIWTFSKEKSDGFFNIDTGGYGVSNSIIFRPDNIGQYSGAYEVEISGLKKMNGFYEEILAFHVTFY